LSEIGLSENWFIPSQFSRMSKQEQEG